MIRMFRAVPFALLFLCSTSSVDRVEAQISLPQIEPSTLVDHLSSLSRYADAVAVAALDPVSHDADVSAGVSAKPSDPVPFLLSTMTADLVPPFAAHPGLAAVKSDSQPKTGLQEGTADWPGELSFEENTPVTAKEETIDQCCIELANMIAGNLESEISLDAKKLMVETALKMVSRNVALKAEAEITKLKAEHAIRMARMQSQMGQMRSLGSAAHQINAIAGPLSQMLQRNYQQSMAANQASERLAQTLAQIGFQRLENEAVVAQQRREPIRLTRPPSTESQQQLETLSAQIAYLQDQLQSFEHRAAEQVEPAGYNQSLRPLRQPLAPQGHRTHSSAYRAR